MLHYKCLYSIWAKAYSIQFINVRDYSICTSGLLYVDISLEKIRKQNSAVIWIDVLLHLTLEYVVEISEVVVSKKTEKR